MAERKMFNFPSVILREKTIERFGYDPDVWGRTSSMHILASCRFCGLDTEMSKGNFNKAGSACHKECRLKEQSIAGSPFKDATVRDKAKQTNLERYGNESASKSAMISKKISDTKKTDESRQKTIETNMSKYGVDNVSKVQVVKDKMKQTFLQKYGADHPMKNKEHRRKFYATMVEKYGVINPMQSDKSREKARATNRDRYGADYAQQTAKWKENASEQNKKRIQENATGKYDLINTLRGEEFWKMLSGGKLSLKEVCTLFSIEYQSVTSRLLSDEFADKYYSSYSFPRQQSQKELHDFLEINGIKTHYNDRSTIGPLEIDIYIPDHKFGIEFNGSYWHSEACLDIASAKQKHIKKTRLCKDKGIRLFHIFEHQWMFKQKQILAILKARLNLNTTNVYARNCSISDVDSKSFLREYHLQGSSLRTIRSFNLVYKDEMVATMCAGTHHRQNNDSKTIVLNRLCFKDGVNVSGGSAKLFNSFLEWAKSESYNRVITWSDSSISEGTVYGKLGFNLEKEYEPDYFYWDAKTNIYRSKQSQRKSNNGCPEGVTERDWCAQHRLWRIWDCGKKLWVYNI